MTRPLSPLGSRSTTARVTAALAAVLLMTACPGKPGPGATAPPHAPGQPAGPQAMGHPSTPPGLLPPFTGTVVETMSSGGYTYARVDRGDDKIWVAAPKVEIRAGEPVRVGQSSPMKEFSSKTLDRKFDVILFAEGMHQGGEGAAAPASPHAAASAPGAPAATPASPTAAPAQGPAKESNIATVLSEAKTLAGQRVTLRGTVRKSSSGIMGRNWLHVVDPSTPESAPDLTVTTLDTAQVGDKVKISGTVAVERDFGAGYRYAVMLEDATVTID